MTDDFADAERMVLRTVYLPPDLDEKLRVFAFRMHMSKGDVIRQAVARELGAFTGFGEDGEPPKTASRTAGPGKGGSTKPVQASTRAKGTTGSPKRAKAGGG